MGLDKVMAEVGGVPVIVRCIEAFQQAPSVAEVVVVTKEELVPEIARLCQEFALDKVAKVIRGGTTRTESARMGTLEADQNLPVIAIHDGARPFVTVQVIEAAVAQAALSGAAAPAVPVKDTIKTANNSVVEETLDRARLYAVQTPQVFDGRTLIEANRQELLPTFTDDASVVEAAGLGPLALVEGDTANIKVTNPGDIERIMLNL